MNEADQKNLPDAFPVLISVTGKNSPMDGQEEGDTVRLMTTGMAQKTDDGWKLDYEETDPDSGTKQYITLELREGSVSMMRKGPYGTGMVFERDTRFEGFYRTPYGDLNMGVYATRVHWRVENGQGVVNLKYQLDLQGQFAAVHELNLRFARNG